MSSSHGGHSSEDFGHTESEENHTTYGAISQSTKRLAHSQNTPSVTSRRKRASTRTKTESGDDGGGYSGRQTGIRKIKARVSSLENTLTDLVPLMIAFAKQYNSDNKVVDTTAATTSNRIKDSSERSLLPDQKESIHSKLLNKSPEHDRFCKLDYSHHLINLFFTIHEVTGQKTVINRRQFFDKSYLSTNIALGHAMFAFSAQYSNHPTIASNWTKFSDYFSERSLVTLTQKYNSGETVELGEVLSLVLLASLRLLQGRPMVSWQLVGRAIILGRTLGLGQPAADCILAPASLYDDQLHQDEVWTVCEFLDNELSQLLGKPQLIKQDTQATQPKLLELPPLTPDPYVQSCLTTLPPATLHTLQATQQLLHQQQILAQLHTSLINLPPSQRVAQLHLFSTSLSQWHLSLPDLITYRPEYHHPVLLSRFPLLHQLIHLKLLYFHLQLAIYRPILEHPTPIVAPILPMILNYAYQADRILEDWISQNQLSSLVYSPPPFSILDRFLLGPQTMQATVYSPPIDPTPSFLSSTMFPSGLTYVLTLRGFPQHPQARDRLDHLLINMTSIPNWVGADRIVNKLNELCLLFN